MKAIVITAVAILLAISLCAVARADWREDVEILKAEFKPFILYSITENQVTYATGVQLLGFRGWEIDGIYSNDKNMPALGVAYELNYLEKLGIDVPIAKYCTASIGGYVGSRDFTSEDRKSDWGILATIFKIEF